MQNTDLTRLRDLLVEKKSDLTFDISGEQIEKLTAYVGLMHKWNKAYNLTAVRNPEEMLVKHIIDSLVILPYVQGCRFIDVGTGPGLPGIPLSIMLPDADFTLLDSLGKRVRFMTQCKHELALSNIQPIQSRVEQFEPDQLYDGVLSRAFASLKDMLHWCSHLVAPQGLFIALKGQYPTTELAEISERFAVQATHSVTVPDLEGERHLVLIKKQ